MYWFDYASTHFAIGTIEGVLIGYLLKYVVDNVVQHMRERREQKQEDFESVVEEIFWAGASTQGELSEHDAAIEARDFHSASADGSDPNTAVARSGDKRPKKFAGAA